MKKILPEKVRSLVFKGGGVKGIAYLGCLTEIENFGVKLNQIEKVVGTSAGAITALLVALNIPVNELEEYLDQDFTHFLDLEDESLKARITSFSDANIASKSKTLSAASSEFSSGDKLGLATGENFREWVEQIILEKTRIPFCTFEEFSTKGFKDLYVVAFDLTSKTPLVFSKDKTPKAIISDAIRSSISIPFVFQPHHYYCKNKEGVIRQVSSAMKDHLLLDGGMVMNYPIQVMDTLPTTSGENEALGFYLTSLKIQSERWEKKLNKPKIPEDDDVLKRIIDNNKPLPGNKSYFYTLNVRNCYKAQGKQHVDYEHKKNENRTIYVDNLGISSLHFNINPVEKTNLIEEGKEAVKAYFQNGLTSSNEKLQLEMESQVNKPKKWRFCTCCCLC